jgi:general secretion pathway protein B
MSFILDALKKSETDRQRQNGPALFEVRVAPPRTGLPLWAMGLAALLAVNLVIVAWVLLRRPASAEVANAAPNGQTAGVAQGPSSAAYGGSGPALGAQPYANAAAGQGGQGYPGGGQSPTGYAGGPTQQGAQSSPAAGNGQGMQPYQAPGSGAPGSSPGFQQGQGMGPGAPGGPGAVTVAGTAPNSPLAQTAGMTAPAYAPGAQPAGGNGQTDGSGAPAGGQLNPDDYAPATDAPAPAAFGNHVSRGTSSGVPLYQDAALVPGMHIPELRLDLHVFAAKPQDRFVMINMHKLHEGDTLPEGVHVESITPEGAVLSSNGTRFLLPRD